MKRTAILLALGVVLLLAGHALAQGTPSIPWSVIGGGGGHAEAGAYALDGTVGQPMVGQVSNLPYSLCSGYWCGITGAVGAQYRLYLPLVLRNF